MKLIKKIAAIMLSIMMVLGMASVVSADGTTETGTITIDNAINDQKYTIYKLLDLESYDATNNLYSYKPAAEWETFFKTEGQGKAYVDINENGYVTWKTGETDDKAAELAQKALAYAKGGINNITTKTEVTASGTTVTFDNLSLGYYLVDSSLGSLCSLNTTNPTVTIKEKNGEPTVEKKIDIGTEGNEKLVEKNSVNLGDTVLFKTTINVKPGAEKYILHDQMNSNLEKLSILHIYDNKNDNYKYVDKDNIEIVYSTVIADGCTFEIKFLDKFYQDRAEFIDKGELTTITVQYAAAVKSEAPIKTAMENKTWLTYGENNTKSNESVTNTYTFEIPVFKYTGSDKALEGAKFSLYSDADCTDANKINLFKVVDKAETYRKFIAGEDSDAKKVTEITTNTSGRFDITGLKAGTYYLKEIEAPKGYNKLKDPVTVVISEDGTITVGEDTTTSVDEVKVLNNTGTILPTTGGNGTSLIYFLGAVLALVSGVVLITKQRMKNS